MEAVALSEGGAVCPGGGGGGVAKQKLNHLFCQAPINLKEEETKPTATGISTERLLFTCLEASVNNRNDLFFFLLLSFFFLLFFFFLPFS